MKYISNISIISTIAVLAVCPAFADIATNNATPTCDSTTIGATSGDTALDAVWNIVNQTCTPGQYFDMTTATCVTCSANSYCPGGTYNVESQTNGLNSCPNGYGLSATGADAQTDCYRTCTTNDVAHSTGVTGGYYYGDNNQCGATGCATGWHLQSFNLTEEFARTNPADSSFGWVSSNGTYGTNTGLQQTETGLTQPNTWAVKYNGMGIVYGKALCSKTYGNNNRYTWSDPTSFDSLTDETGQEGAKFCYCNITGYKSVDENMRSLSSVWLFASDHGNASNCSSSSGCVFDCARYVPLVPYFREALFGVVAPSLATCEANTINITWYNEGNVHDENTCTYSESVTLPETNPQRTGYTFTGWTVRPTSNE